jgi:transcriptional regulator with XRE-family HTH domain
LFEPKNEFCTLSFSPQNPQKMRRTCAKLPRPTIQINSVRSAAFSGPQVIHFLKKNPSIMKDLQVLFLRIGFCYNSQVPKLSGKMNERERGIGQRVRLLRGKLRYSQREFGGFIGLTRIQIAAIEAGQTPLKYHTAEMLLSSSGANPVWLATGEGSIGGHFHLPSLGGLRRGDNELFSEVFFSDLRPLFENEKPDPEAEMDLRYQLAHTNGNVVKHWFIEYVPDGRVRELDKKLSEMWSGFLPWDKLENPKRRLQRVIWFKKMAESIKAKSDAENELSENTPLTASSLKSKTDSGMKTEIQKLIERVSRKASKPGAKAALAKELRVAPARISEWLSGEKEPGGEYTLRLLNWVEQQ